MSNCVVVSARFCVSFLCYPSNTPNILATQVNTFLCYSLIDIKLLQEALLH